MSISSIKKELLRPERELIINKNFMLRNKQAIIASITEQEDNIKLWIFQQRPDSPFANIGFEEFTECVTNREQILRRASIARVDFAHISEITIQGVNLPILQSCYGVVGRDPMVHMKLQHFIEAGVDFSSVEDIDFNELVLGEYHFKEDSVFPEIDTGADMPICISIRENAMEVLAAPSQRFSLKIGEQNIAGSFKDQSSGKEILYYIDRVVLHDIWKETEERFNDENTLRLWKEHGLDDAAIEQARVSFPESLERICPRGHVMLILQYECPDNIQLNFYTTEFLLSKPENTGSGIAVALVGSTDEESKHGCQVRSCLLKTVPADYDGFVEAELISWFKNIPLERIYSR